MCVFGSSEFMKESERISTPVNLCKKQNVVTLG